MSFLLGHGHRFCHQFAYNAVPQLRYVGKDRKLCTVHSHLTTAMQYWLKLTPGIIAGTYRFMVAIARLTVS